MSSKLYYKDIGLVRLFACIAVFLYHLGILKGGYLAVCIFFVLNGYLSCVSCFKKEKFSLKKYYINKFLHLYLPMLLVSFFSIALINLFTDINWYNLKPETNSVLLGYNNFWQLEANMDYFASHNQSPFIHLWYMGIILQVELLFPFVYLFFRKLGDKFHKIFPCILLGLIAIISSFYFYKSSLSANIMFTYYSTFTRIFSVIFGILLGFLHSYNYLLVPKFLKSKTLNRIIFYFYLIIIFILCIFIDAANPLFNIAMIITTLLTCRLIDYGTLYIKDNLSIFDKFIKFLSGISYEVYLIQYPIIVLFSKININICLKNLLIIIITILLSYIFNTCLKISIKNRKNFNIKLAGLTIILTVSLFGLYLYFITEDNTKELAELQAKLEENQLLMENRQKEYAEKLQKEQEELLKQMQELDDYETQLDGMIHKLPIVGIGDSVMLGALDTLNTTFPNGYFDAKVSRTAWVANDILVNLKKSGMLGDPVIINLGANGDCSMDCKKKIMNTLGNRKVFWLNVVNYDSVNRELIKLENLYDNLYIIDWKSISSNHPEYFIADGIHLKAQGKKAYADAIKSAIYNVYLDEYQRRKDELLNSYEENQKQKIGFIGNSLLVNAFDNISVKFEDAQFVTNAQFNYQTIKKEIVQRLENEELNHKLVFLFDSNVELTSDQFQDLIDLCTEHEIYIVDINDKMNGFQYQNVKVLNFYEEIMQNDNYLLVDKIHLTQDGNEALSMFLYNSIIGGV